MSLKTFMLAALIFIAHTNFAQQNMPLEKTVFWQVTGNGIAKPSYLFGTIHLMRSTDIKLTDTLLNKLYTADAVYFETRPLLHKDTMAKLPKNDVALSLLMKDGMFDNIVAAIKKYYTISKDSLEYMHPFLVRGMLMRSLYGQRLIGYEDTLRKLLKGRKQILGLEDVGAHLKVLDGLNFIKELNKLMNLYKYKNDRIKGFTTLMDTYNKQDLEAINLGTQGEYANDVMYKNRNEAWVPVIENAVKGKSCFFAFGAGHLGGDNGVIVLLRKRGFVVSPVYL